MAISFLLLLLLLTLLSLLDPTLSFKPKSLNYSLSFGWSPAGATWYGSPNGYGSDGKGKHFSDDDDDQVKCSNNAACSNHPVTVVITDECPGGPCVAQPYHFDLSGTAFGAMAISGRANELRNAGAIQIQYIRVPCNYYGINIVFHVDSGANPYYFAVVAEYVAGDGDLGAVELLPSCTGAKWQAMQNLNGAVWKLNWASPLQPPFSLRLTTLATGKTLTAINVIPQGWKPGTSYKSSVNYIN
ncbi:expansin-B15-like [Dendrobium catenatum]|uniref:expansin-B15-like n=1 Tax=Dendrobium catenatum TaxID=906689 RepID=UPI0009F71E28|nr:expansin-B15-like [Dendrobium catenatum]